MYDYSLDRIAMVEEQIKVRGVRFEKMLDAMLEIPRERFLRKRLRELAYEDTQLPIAGW